MPYASALDGLRGLSVLSVLIFHAVPTWLTGGFLGVDIFFVLSGFLITSLLLKEFDDTGKIDFLKFYSRRWFRLAPALMLLLLVYVFVLYAFVSGASFLKQGVDVALAMTYTTNWARAWSLKESADLGHTWSLAVEAQFYLLWPFVVWALLKLLRKNSNLISIFVCLAITSLAIRLYLLNQGATIERVYNGLDTRFETLVWGAVLAAYMRVRRPQASACSAMYLDWAACFALITLFLEAQWTSALYYELGITVVSILAAFLIFSTVIGGSNLIKNILEYPIFVWIGSVSYGIYLWHFPIIRMLLNLDISGIYLLVSVLSLTLPIAAISHYFLELPTQIWNKRRISGV